VCCSQCSPHHLQGVVLVNQGLLNHLDKHHEVVQQTLVVFNQVVQQTLVEDNNTPAGGVGDHWMQLERRATRSTVYPPCGVCCTQCSLAEVVLLPSPPPPSNPPPHLSCTVMTGTPTSL